MGEWIEVEATEGGAVFAAWLARPDAPPRAGLVLVQEIFGINRAIRQLADTWAGKGYLVLAPDLAWRFAPRFEADPDSAEQVDQAMRLRDQLDLDAAVADVEASMRHARTLLGRDHKVGVLGYCWGGSIAYLAAARCDTAASVGYYGRLIVEHLGEAHAIARPLLLHFGAEDPSIPVETRRALHAALDGHPNVSIQDYPGAAHGFAAPFGRRRHEAAALRADARTEAFLEEHLA